MVKVISATKEGFEIANEGDSINFSVTNSATRRGRVGKLQAQTLDTQSQQAVIVASRGRGENNEQMLEERKDGQSNTLTGVSKDNMLLEKTSIRRLTEIECERLQGFPEQEIKLSICFDNQKKNANAEIQNHKSQKRALVAEKKELSQNVLCVDQNLNISNQQIKKHAQQIVHINLGDSKVEILNQEKLIWCASIVETKNQLVHLLQIEDFVLLIVLIRQIQEKIILTGKEELQVNEQYSILQKNGEMLVKLYGSEIMQLANDAEIDLTIPKELLKSTISDHLNLKNIEQILTTLFYYACHVITGFTQTQTQKENLLFQITLNHGWTKFGNHDGTVKQISKTQRYKMCGNAVTVAVVELIGKKLLKVSNK